MREGLCHAALAPGTCGFWPSGMAMLTGSTADREGDFPSGRVERLASAGGGLGGVRAEGKNTEPLISMDTLASWVPWKRHTLKLRWTRTSQK